MTTQLLVSHCRRNKVGFKQSRGKDGKGKGKGGKGKDLAKEAGMERANHHGPESEMREGGAGGAS